MVSAMPSFNTIKGLEGIVKFVPAVDGADGER